VERSSVTSFIFQLIGGIKIKCYMCALEGKDTDALAICIVCGMGICKDHLIREELEIWKGDYPFPSKRFEKTLPRFLCEWCYEAYQSG
jgi:hypothetical protein